MVSSLVCSAYAYYLVTTNSRQGVAFQDVAKGKLYPSVSLKKAGEHVLVNFGQTPFVYNIDDMMRVRATFMSVSAYTDKSRNNETRFKKTLKRPIHRKSSPAWAKPNSFKRWLCNFSNTMAMWKRHVPLHRT